MSYDSYRGAAGRGGSDRGSGYGDDFHGSSNFQRGGGFRGRGGRRGVPYRGGRGGYGGGYNSSYYGSNYRGRGGYYNKYSNHNNRDNWSRGSSYSEQEEQEEQPEHRDGSVEHDEEEGGHSSQDFSHGRGGSGYRGGSFRGGYKSRNGSTHHSGEYYKSGGVVDKNSRHYKEFLHDTKLKEFQNPWINIMGITDETRQASLEESYHEQAKADETIRDLQKRKLRLEMALSSLEKHAAREELHVQLTNEKLDEFVYI
ncbi:hypothetical protein KGF57_002332 [Candida theae]|uniref:Transcription regulator LGE1 helical region domain-containing protein n=1 Tax=Candida theae TaxID=1198502 RepID=A0AAD5FZ60_9ASCO|nr:uncharacterized protein KGF57_002332 [Candida theae]KAI5958898.1 hypothetical protein KGF57_002332 [Candida theae]